MGLLGRVKTFFRSENPVALPDHTNDFWYTLINGLQKVGNQTVNADSVQRIAAVYACQTAICESVAMLPAIVFSEEDERVKKKLKDHPLFPLLRDAPNKMMDSFEFFESLQQSLLDDGNAYTHILRTKSGKIIELTPLPWEKVEVKVGLNNRLAYEYQDPTGQTRQYTDREIFHLKYKTKDGLKGRSPVQVVGDTFAFAQSLQQHGNQLFDAGAFMSGFITAPFPFKDDEARKNFMSSFKKYMGAKNAGGFALLEQGTDYKPFSMNNTDAQFIESRQFSVLDIARIYRVPPVMIQVTESGMSYASIEQLAIIWVQNTIQPWVTRYERAIKRQLLDGDPSLYVRFNVSALIRGDLKSRTESLVQQLQYGLKTINEARSLLDENAIDDPKGDEVFVSHNLIPISKAGEQQQPAQNPESAQEKPKKEQKSAKNEAFKPLFKDILGRFARREQKAIDAARAKPGFDKWCLSFFEEHKRALKAAIEPAFLALDGENSERAEQFCFDYCAERTDAVLLKDGISAEELVDLWVEEILEGGCDAS